MSRMEIAMSKIFTAVKPALLAIDAVITRMILRFWIVHAAGAAPAGSRSRSIDPVAWPFHGVERES